MLGKGLNKVKPGDIILSSHYNDLVDAVNRLMGLIGGGGISNSAMIALISAPPGTRFVFQTSFNYYALDSWNHSWSTFFWQPFKMDDYWTIPNYLWSSDSRYGAINLNSRDAVGIPYGGPKLLRVGRVTEATRQAGSGKIAIPRHHFTDYPQRSFAGNRPGVPRELTAYETNALLFSDAWIDWTFFPPARVFGRGWFLLEWKASLGTLTYYSGWWRCYEARLVAVYDNGAQEQLSFSVGMSQARNSTQLRPISPLPYDYPMGSKVFFWNNFKQTVSFMIQVRSISPTLPYTPSHDVKCYAGYNVLIVSL